MDAQGIIFKQILPAIEVLCRPKEGMGQGYRHGEA